MISKSKFLLTIAILCFTGMVAVAGNAPVFSVKVVDPNAFLLQLTDVEQAQIQITLRDANGATLHTETLKQNRVDQRKYDIKELPAGNYSLIVAYDAVIKIQPIKKGFDTLEIDAVDLQTVFQPVIRQNSAHLYLDMLCLSEDVEISLAIKDAEGRVIYDEVVQPKGALQKRFNLSRLGKGTYTFTVGVVDTVLIKEFNKTIEWSPTISSL